MRRSVKNEKMNDCETGAVSDGCPLGQCRYCCICTFGPGYGGNCFQWLYNSDKRFCSGASVQSSSSDLHCKRTKRSECSKKDQHFPKEQSRVRQIWQSHQFGTKIFYSITVCHSSFFSFGAGQYAALSEKAYHLDFSLFY